MSQKLYQLFHKTIKKYINDNNFNIIKYIFTDIFDGLSMQFEDLEYIPFKFQKIQSYEACKKILYWSNSKKSDMIEPGTLTISIKNDDGLLRKCTYKVFIDSKQRAVFQRDNEKRLLLKEFVSIFMKYPQQISIEEEHDRIQKALFMHI